jgi:hypothetical protein
VLADISSVLSGGWYPADEPDPELREMLVAAARLRFYARRERCGWTLATTAKVRHQVVGRQGDRDWAAGLIPAVDGFIDSPPARDFDSLVVMLTQSGMEPLDADVLAHAVLYRQIDVVVSRHPRQYRHNRVGDLPAGLEIIDPVEAAQRLAIGVGEKPVAAPPNGSLLSMAEPWWIPADSPAGP